MSSSTRALALMLPLLAVPVAARADEAVFAVIVGSNDAPDTSLAPLRFADDDAARYLETLGTRTESARVLTVLDADSQKLYPEVARRALPPTHKALRAALASAFAEIEAANRAGRRTVFYFVYVGHGSVGDDGEGTMHLLDGRFSRSDLYQEVIAESPATVNHVVIDACNAYLMVARRGGEDPEVKQAVDDFLDRESLARHPNTGVLVSTTKASEVHEWARYAAGVFSHEVRSGMVGAADVDDDGEVSYDEIRAFVAAANAHVADPKAKLRAFALAPALDRREPFARPRASQRALSVVVPATLRGHSFLEDARGVRVADFHAAQTLTLRVPPASTYFLHVGTDEIRLPAEGLAVVDAGKHPRVPTAIAARGAEVVTFQRDLFAVPFSTAYFQGFSDATTEPDIVRVVRSPEAGAGPATRTVVGVAMLGTGGVLAATGVGLALAAHEADEGTEEREEGRSTAGGDTLRTASTVLLGSALGLAVVGLGVWLWPSE
jgi:hypothetical protein